MSQHLRELRAKHVLVFAMMMGAVAAQLAGVKDWRDVASPLFISGLLGTISTNLVSIFMDAPKNEKHRREDPPKTDFKPFRKKRSRREDRR